MVMGWEPDGFSSLDRWNAERAEMSNCTWVSCLDMGIIVFLL